MICPTSGIDLRDRYPLQMGPPVNTFLAMDAFLVIHWNLCIYSLNKNTYITMKSRVN